MPGLSIRHICPTRWRACRRRWPTGRGNRVWWCCPSTITWTPTIWPTTAAPLPARHPPTPTSPRLTHLPVVCACRTHNMPAQHAPNDLFLIGGRSHVLLVLVLFGSRGQWGAAVFSGRMRFGLQDAALIKVRSKVAQVCASKPSDRCWNVTKIVVWEQKFFYF